MDFDYYVIGPLMIFGPWLVSGFLGWRWGRTWVGVAGAMAIGLMLTVAALAAFVLTAPPLAEKACGEDECVKYFGQWLEVTLARGWPIYAVASWTVSVAVVSAVRRGDPHASLS